MKRIALVSIAAAALSLSALPGASAADLPVKAVPMAVVDPGFTWSGFYVGLNAGVAWQHQTWTYTNPVPNAPPTSSAHDINKTTGIFGVHGGALYQFQNNIVVGVEVAYSPLRSGFATSGLQCVAVAGSQCQASAQNLFTAGGRLGYAWSRWLAYVSGGWARLNIDTRELTVPPVIFDTTSARHNGYYIGGGLDYAVVNYLVIGVEYQHVDVRTAFHASSADAFGPAPPGVNGRNIRGTEDIFRVRLSLKTNGMAFAP